MSRSRNPGASSQKTSSRRLPSLSSANGNPTHRLPAVVSSTTTIFNGVQPQTLLRRTSVDVGSPQLRKAHGRLHRQTHTTTRTTSPAPASSQVHAVIEALAFPTTAPCLIRACEIFQAATTRPTCIASMMRLGEVRMLKRRDVSKIGGALLGQIVRTTHRRGPFMMTMNIGEGMEAVDTTTGATSLVATRDDMTAVTTLRFSLHAHCQGIPMSTSSDFFLLYIYP
jgi:hypothetical protein